MSESLSEIAYNYISKKLISSEWGPGTKISEPTLAAECGISRTPVRQAIQKMVQEGLLYQIPASGTYVAKMNRRQLIDVYDIRVAIECHSLVDAVQHLTRENRQELRLMCDKMHGSCLAMRKQKLKVLEGAPLVTFLAADLQFHLILLKAAGNRLAMQVVTSAYQRNVVFGHHTHVRDLHHVAWVWRDHTKIEQMIHKGDVAGAQKWMRIHITRSLNDALAALDQTDDQNANGGANEIDAAIDQLTSRLKE